MQLKDFKTFIEKLKIRGAGEHEQDKDRRLRRKRLLEMESYQEKEFLPRDLTQTSQLVRLGAQVLKRAFADCKEKPTIISLPGSVTGTVRKAWKVLGCLSLANPQVLDENGEVKNKTDIRDITHLHHALDACVLGLSSHFIPNNGRVWELIVKRNPNDLEKRQLEALGVFGFNAERRFEMRDLDDKLKKQICQRLAEKRVVQHVPARMDGLRVEQNTWRVVSSDESGNATIRQRIRQADGSRPKKVAEEKATKLLGLKPANGNGKLAAKKGVLVIPDNYGVALDPLPTIIPFHKVWPRLQELKKANGGKLPRVLRNGQIVKVPEGKYKGVWRIFSAKNNSKGMAIDIGQPDVVRLKNKTEGHKINVLLASLLKSKMKVVKTPFTGISAVSTTASA
jgi:CRISPR-associated endonuclease Csn1